MFKKALGLIETYGYIGAIEAADVCLKTADIELIGLECVKGGLVTIKICGDVSAVKASIDAGAIAADRVGKVISIDVIARMGEGLEKILNMPEKEIKKEVQSERKINFDEKNKIIEQFNEDIVETSIAEDEDLMISKREETKLDEKYIINYQGKMIDIRDKEQLMVIKVVDLRKIARGIDGIPLDRTQIKFAKKLELVETITSCFKKGAK